MLKELGNGLPFRLRLSTNEDMICMQSGLFSKFQEMLEKLAL